MHLIKLKLFADDIQQCMFAVDVLTEGRGFASLDIDFKTHAYKHARKAIAALVNFFRKPIGEWDIQDAVIAIGNLAVIDYKISKRLGLSMSTPHEDIINAEETIWSLKNNLGRIGGLYHDFDMGELDKSDHIGFIADLSRLIVLCEERYIKEGFNPPSYGVSIKSCIADAFAMNHRCRSETIHIPF